MFPLFKHPCWNRKNSLHLLNKGGSFQAKSLLKIQTREIPSLMKGICDSEMCLTVAQTIALLLGKKKKVNVSHATQTTRKCGRQEAMRQAAESTRPPGLHVLTTTATVLPAGQAHEVVLETLVLGSPGYQSRSTCHSLCKLVIFFLKIKWG